MPLPAGTVPPLVDRQTFAAIQERLRRNKETATRNNSDPEGSLLRGGFVKCGVCGHTLRVSNRAFDPTLPPMYICEPSRGRESCGKTRITIKTLDASVWGRVEAVLLHPEIVRRQLDRLQGDDGLGDDLDTIDRAIAEADRKRANLIRSLALFDRQEDAEPIVAEIAQLAKRRAGLVAERDTLLARRSQRDAVYATLLGIEEWCRVVSENLQHLSYQERRIAIEALGVSVKVFPRGQNPRHITEMDPTIVDSSSW